MITLDTGALIAVERRDRSMLAFLTHAAARGHRLTVPTCVVGEWWRGQRGPAARILDAVVVEPLSLALAKLAGEAMAAVTGATLVDAVVVASAAQRGDLVTGAISMIDPHPREPSLRSVTAWARPLEGGPRRPASAAELKRGGPTEGTRPSRCAPRRWAHDGQPETGAALVGAGGDEATEEALLHVAADLAVVLHRDGDLAAIAGDGQRHRGAVAVGARVVEQVVEGAAQPQRVAAHLGVGAAGVVHRGAALARPLGGLAGSDPRPPAPRPTRARLDARQVSRPLSTPRARGGPWSGHEARRSPAGQRAVGEHSALARMAATGSESCERSAAKVSTKGRPSSSRRMESMPARGVHLAALRRRRRARRCPR